MPAQLSPLLVLVPLLLLPPPPPPPPLLLLLQLSSNAAESTRAWLRSDGDPFRAAGLKSGVKKLLSWRPRSKLMLRPCCSCICCCCNCCCCSDIFERFVSGVGGAEGLKTYAMKVPTTPFQPLLALELLIMLEELIARGGGVWCPYAAVLLLDDE